MLSKEELHRYNRHIILPEIGQSGQEKLQQSKVLVVGAGGLGCPVLQYLTAAGVGTIGICDFDFIELSNLQRQILFDPSEIGKSKAEVAAEKLAKQNPQVNFVVLNQMLTKENALSIFSEYDIIVDASDNFPTRFLVNDACVILNKPFVFGAIYKFEGQVSVFNYRGGATYRCLVSEEPLQKEVLSCSEIGVMGVIPGLIGCYQAIEVIKMICNIGKVLSGKLLLIDTLTLAQTTIEIKRNAKNAAIRELGNYGDFCENTFVSIKQIKPGSLFGLLQQGKVKVIDIRDKEKYKQYHIESENIPIQFILDEPGILSKNIDLVFLCEIGQSSKSLIEFLSKSNNFRNISNLEGGIQAWIRDGLPVISEK